MAYPRFFRRVNHPIYPFRCSLLFISDIRRKALQYRGSSQRVCASCPLLCMVITSYTTGAKIKQNGTLMRWLMNIGLILVTVSLTLAIFLNTNLYVFIGLLSLSGIGSGLLLPCLNTMITGSVERDQRGMITSLYNSLRFIGVAFGPPLFGWLMNISHKTLFITVASLGLLMLALVFFCIKPNEVLKEKA